MSILQDPKVVEFHRTLVALNYWNQYGADGMSFRIDDTVDLFSGKYYGRDSSTSQRRYIGIGLNQRKTLQDFISARLKEKEAEEELKEAASGEDEEVKKEQQRKRELKWEKKLKKELKRIKKQKKELKKAKKALKKVKIADTTKADGDGVTLKKCKLNQAEDGLADVAGSQYVDQQLPDKQVRNLMEGGLKPCAREAEKKSTD